MPLISIIMPVYNAGKYLNAAIESILEQTYKNYELIIIDDGSTDGSYQVAEKYAQKDSRIKLLRQENQGICAARNYALSLVSGEYIVFCDHDDEYLSFFLEHAVDKIEQCPVDAVIMGYKYHKCFDGKKDITTIQSFKDKKFDSDDIKSEYYVLRGYWYRVWGALYNADVIIDNRIMFDTEIKYGGEDISFNADFLKVAKAVMCVEEVGYIHYQREKSSTSAKFDENRLTTIEKQLNKDSAYCDEVYESDLERRKQYLFLCAIQLWTYLEKLNYKSCPYSKKRKKKLIKRITETYIIPKLDARKLFFDIFKYSKKYGIILIACFLRAYELLLFFVKFKRG